MRVLLRTFLLSGFCFCCSLVWLIAGEATPSAASELPDDPAVIARAYLATGDIAVLNRIFRVPMPARGPAVDVLLTELVPSTARPTLERAFTLLRCLDGRRPEVIAALRAFLQPGQPMSGHAIYAIDALGNDGEVLIRDLIAQAPRTAYALSRIGQRGDLVVPALLRSLRGRDGVPYSMAIDALGNPAWSMQAELIVPELTRILATPDPAVEWNSFTTPDAQSIRARAAYALGALGWQAESAIPTLIAALDSDDVYCYRSVMDALRSLRPGSAVAIPRLIEFIRAIPPDPRTERDGKIVVAQWARRSSAFAAIATLKSMGELAAAAAPTLVDLVLGDDDQVSRQATEALAVIGNVSEVDAQRLMATGEKLRGRNGERFFTALRGPGGAGFETLLSRWATADETLRAELDRGLDVSAAPVQATPGLLVLARHGDPLVRRKAIDLLARGHPRPAWVAGVQRELRHPA